MSGAPETPPIRRRPLALIVVFGLLGWAGNAAALVFDEFRYAYTDTVPPGRLISEMVSIGPGAVVRGFFADPFFGMINMAMLLSITAVVLVETLWRQRRPFVLFTITALSIPVGLLAFLSILASLSAGIDGEWLGEGWPIFESFFFWTVALSVYSGFELAQIRADRTSTSVANPNGQLSCPVEAEGSQL